MTRKGQTVRIRRLITAAALCLALPISASAADTVSTTTDPATGDVAHDVYTVHGVVVQRIALESTFVLVGADGSALAIAAPTSPPIGHRAVLRVQRVGATIREVSLVRLGPFVPDVHIRGAVTFVSPHQRRYTLSQGGASIAIRHRLRGALPALDTVVTVGTRITRTGALVERRLIPDGEEGGSLQAVGTLEDVVPPTGDPIITSTEELTSGCPFGCIVVSGDDQGGPDTIPIALTSQGLLDRSDADPLRAAPPLATAAAAVWSVFADIAQRFRTLAGAAAHHGPTQPIVEIGWNQVENVPAIAARTMPAPSSVRVCEASGNDYGLVTAAACPAGTTARRSSTEALTRVANTGAACVTGLTLSSATTVYVTGEAGCISSDTDVSAPVTLK
jgi:hypothetical protein